MKTADEVERAAIELVHKLPSNTVVILANIKGGRYHEVLRGQDILRARQEGGLVQNLYEHDSEDDK